MTKRVLTELAAALPEEGGDLVTRLEVRDIWGNAIHVRIHTMLSRTPTSQDIGNRLRAAVERALGEHRNRVDILWESAG